MRFLIFCLGLAATCCFADATTAYITSGAGDDKVYRVDLTNGSFTAVTSPIPIGLNGIVLQNPDIAFVGGGADAAHSDVFKVDLTTGAASLLAGPIASNGLGGLALDQSAVYAASFDDH